MSFKKKILKYIIILYMDNKIITPDNIDDWFMRRLEIVKKLNKKNNIGKHDQQNINAYLIDHDEMGYF